MGYFAKYDPMILRIGPDGYLVVGSFCQDPSLLGMTLPRNLIMVGLGVQQALAAVGLAKAGPTKVGPCFTKTYLRWAQLPVCRTHYCWVLLTAGPAIAVYCCQHDPAAVGDPSLLGLALPPTQWWWFWVPSRP